MFSPILKGGGIPFARAYLPYILNLRTLVTISLKTAANRGVFFSAKNRVQQLCMWGVSNRLTGIWNGTVEWKMEWNGE